MSVTRLLMSGLLVASGLILASFTLHGAFDAPAGAVAGPALKPWSTSTFGAGGRPVAASADAQEAGSKSQRPRTGAKPGAKAADVAPSVAEADTRTAKKKPRAEKRPTEQAQKTKQQQAASEWPWSWFGN
jgi:hypothetical protein